MFFHLCMHAYTYSCVCIYRSEKYDELTLSLNPIIVLHDYIAKISEEIIGLIKKFWNSLQIFCDSIC